MDRLGAAGRSPGSPARLGTYEIEREVGRGGMGVVYRARSAAGKTVAVKLLRRREADALARFERERRLLAELGEADGFVPLIDAGMSPEGPYLVMPFVEGGTLRGKLEGGPLAVAETIELARTLARALGAAHARGIVHRDVKPENVLFGARPLLADLGLAKHFADGDASLSVSLSVRGAFRGTAGYMPAEQMDDAKHVGAPADVFALGALLYECLAGEPPFVGDTLVELLTQVARGNFPPLAPRSRGAPPWFVAVVERCLALEPRARFADGAALARALDAPRERRRAGPGLAGALAALLAVAAGLAWVHARKRDGVPPRTEPAAVASAAGTPALDPAPSGARGPSRMALEDAFFEALATRDPDERVRKLSRVLALEPTNARALVARGAATVDLAAEAFARVAPIESIGACARRDLDAALALEPRNADALLARARLEGGLRHDDAYLAGLGAAAKVDGGAASDVAAVLLGARKGAPATPERTSALVAAHPDRSDCWELHGDALGDAGRPREAVDAYARALELEESHLVRAKEITCLTALRDWEGTRDAAARWIDARPGVPDPWLARAQARVETGDARGALTDAKRAAELGRPVWAHLLAARALILLGDDDAAIAECDAVTPLPIRPDGSRAWSRVYRAAALERKGDLDAAASELVRAAGEPFGYNREVPGAGVDLALRIERELVEERGDAEAAEALLGKLEGTPLRDAALVRARVHVALARGDLVAARKSLDDAVALAGEEAARPERDEVGAAWIELRARLAPVEAAVDGGDEDALVERARLRALAGEREAVRQQLDVLVVFGKGTSVRARALVARARLPSDAEAAHADVARALELAPELPLALVERAVASARAGRAAEARRDGERAVALAPRDAALRARRAEAALALGDLDAARADASAALALDAKCEDALEVRERIDARAGDRAAQAADLRALAPFAVPHERAALLLRRAAYLEKLAAR